MERYFVLYIYEVGKYCYELETLKKWPSNSNGMLANNITQREHVQGKQQSLRWQSPDTTTILKPIKKREVDLVKMILNIKYITDEEAEVILMQMK